MPIRDLCLAPSELNEFPSFVEISGTDGGLALLGRYQLDGTSSCGCPRYELTGTNNVRSARRFLSVMDYDGGRWVVSEANGVLLWGPLVPKTGRKDTFQGEQYTCVDGCEKRVKGSLAIKVTPCAESDSKLSTDELHALQRQLQCVVSMGRRMQDAEEEEDSDSEDEHGIYRSRKGLSHCSRHRREVCHVCCMDHRPTNDVRRAQRQGREVDMVEILKRHGETQDAEHKAMLALHAAQAAARAPARARSGGRRGGRPLPVAGAVQLGTEEAQALYDAAAAPPPSGHTCARCGRGGKLLMCGRCCSARYCGAEHQREHWGVHKEDCRRLAAAAAAAAAGGAQQQPAPAAHLPLTWEALAEERSAPGKVLELRIVSAPRPSARPAPLGCSCDAKDRAGVMRRLDFACAPPPGLALGAVLRWHHPRYHTFPGGVGGACVEAADLVNLTWLTLS